MAVFVGYLGGRRAFDAPRGLSMRGAGRERAFLENRRSVEKLLEGSS